MRLFTESNYRTSEWKYAMKAIKNYLFGHLAQDRGLKYKIVPGELSSVSKRSGQNGFDSCIFSC